MQQIHIGTSDVCEVQALNQEVHHYLQQNLYLIKHVNIHKRFLIFLASILGSLIHGLRSTKQVLDNLVGRLYVLLG